MQIFHRRSNSISRVTIFGGGALLAALAWALGMLNRSPYETNARILREQPVPFSHKHHARGLGIDCRYCHASVENSSFAGLPPTRTCMTCHSQLWTNAAMLEPVREAYRSGRPLAWTRVAALPKYVFFDHSIHLAKGVGCVECHGHVDRMPLMRQAEFFQMRWCLACHAHPQRHLRPREAVFSMDWEVPAGEDARQLQRWLAETYGVKSRMSCYACHR